MSKILIVIGVVVFAIACRTYQTPLIRRLGGLAILAASFLGPYFARGSLAVGVLGACFWFILPWFEILTRIRAMRLPLERELEERWPPRGQNFPELDTLTEEIEEEGFEQLADTGWSWEGMDQFIRVFFREEDRLQAAIFFTEQEGMSFYHTGLITRTSEDRHLLTWNYPFSYTMLLPPGMQMHRVSTSDDPAGGFSKLVRAHLEWLAVEAIDPASSLPLTAEELDEVMRQDMRRQVEHNLDEGIIMLADEGTFRYSVKGYFFLWTRIVLDMLRLV